MSQKTMDQWLRAILDEHGAVAGTVHVLKGSELEMSAAVNIPPDVQKATMHIPRGKGMAGLAWAEGRAITTCNLKEDTTGAVKPGAKAVDAKAAVALPVLDPSGAVHAVIGLAFADTRTFSEHDLQKMTESVMGMPA